MKTLYLKFPFQSAFAITTNSQKLINCLSLRYGKYLTFASLSDCDFEITVTQSRSAYHLETDQNSLVTNQPLAEIDRYIFENNIYHTDFFALHGAAVEWKKRCHLFLASTTSGKTTLTGFLTAHGCGYLTDDCILLNRSNFKIHPFTTPIQLREGGLSVLQQYHVPLPKLQALEEPPSLHRWVYIPSYCIQQPIPLQTIFFLQRNEKENHLIPMSTTERITELMKSPITQYPITGEYLRFLTRLAKTPCFRLRYGDMNYVKELIQNEP
ncbi:MAG: hypothetical protein J6S14_08615 [Clostridia bacterium]|nr:hypothetical protein [Clostridia bacterium]